MENNTLLNVDIINILVNGDIINIFGKILASRYKIKNQAIVPTYFYTSLLDHSWEKGPQRYFKQYTILKNGKKRNWNCRPTATSLDSFKMCIPINIVDQGVGHWILVIRIFKFTNDGTATFQLYYFDSLNSTNEMDKIKEKLIEIDLCKYQNQNPIVSWTWVKCLYKMKLNVVHVYANIL